MYYVVCNVDSKIQRSASEFWLASTEYSSSWFLFYLTYMYNKYFSKQIITIEEAAGRNNVQSAT